MPKPYAASDRSEESSQKIPPDLGWGNIAEQGIEIHRIPGDRVGILKEPHLQILAVRFLIIVPYSFGGILDPFQRSRHPTNPGN